MSDTAAANDTTELEVVDQPDRGRYELLRNGTMIGYADYSLRGDEITIPHVETDAAQRGQGLGSRLMDGVIADVVDRNLTVVPVCPFAAAYLHEHPDLAYLIKR
ncbi:MAG: N-acetyltransferase [Microthrixaceae bacterium]|nr:N-acetyltransferase [Microthrixaceae bacterium]